MAETAYDRIGVGYGKARHADPKIAAQIASALGDANSVLNIGAGAGSYEAADREVVAIEPWLTRDYLPGLCRSSRSPTGG